MKRIKVQALIMTPPVCLPHHSTVATWMLLCHITSDGGTVHWHIFCRQGVKLCIKHHAETASAAAAVRAIAWACSSSDGCCFFQKIQQSQLLLGTRQHGVADCPTHLLKSCGHWSHRFYWTLEQQTKATVQFALRDFLQRECLNELYKK